MSLYEKSPRKPNITRIRNISGIISILFYFPLLLKKRSFFLSVFSSFFRFKFNFVHFTYCRFYSSFTFVILLWCSFNQCLTFKFNSK